MHIIMTAAALTHISCGGVTPALNPSYKGPGVRTLAKIVLPGSLVKYKEWRDRWKGEDSRRGGRKHKSPQSLAIILRYASF